MSIPVLCGYLIFKITDAFGFSILSEWSNHLFWFIEKKTELENHWLQVFQKHQRTATVFMKEWAKNRSLERWVSEIFKKD
jgi:hypothetical protein